MFLKNMSALGNQCNLNEHQINDQKQPLYSHEDETFMTYLLSPTCEVDRSELH